LIIYIITSIIFYLGASTQLDDIMNTVDRLQQFRLDDQRTNFPSSTNSNAKNQRFSPSNEQFFDQLAKCQVSFENEYLHLFFSS
jgi:hypothetical protein